MAFCASRRKSPRSREAVSGCAKSALDGVSWNGCHNGSSFLKGSGIGIFASPELFTLSSPGRFGLESL
jgi:hypothetical protein